MRKKNMVRVLRGHGQSGAVQDMQRYSHHAVRAAVRACLREATKVPRLDRGELEAPQVVVPHGYRERTSREWNVLNRWLDAQCGRPWCDVRPLLQRRCRAHGGRGHYLLRQFLKWEVSPHEEMFSLYFFLDEQGILRRRERTARRKWMPQARENSARASLRQWAGERRVRRVGKALYWCLPAYRSDEFSGWRQERLLNSREEGFYNSFPEAVRLVVTNNI